MYDAAWSIALMLNKSISFLQKVNKTLETITYRDAVAAKIMNKILRLTDFAGMSVGIIRNTCLRKFTP